MRKTNNRPSKVFYCPNCKDLTGHVKVKDLESGKLREYSCCYCGRAFIFDVLGAKKRQAAERAGREKQRAGNIIPFRGA